MKKRFLLMVGLLPALISCNSSNNAPTPNNPSNPSTSLNATEQSLVGTWYLKKEHTVDDSIVTSFSGTPYAQFLSTMPSSTSNLKDMKDNASLVLPNGGATYGLSKTRGISTASTWWYFDTNNSQLVVNQSTNYYIRSVTATTLVLSPVAFSKDTLWFEK